MAQTAPTVAEGGLVLDRYRPLRPLGSGGSGSVWLARDERNGLDVALKIVPREGKAGHRAEREAQVAARLRHERCLRAYACGSDTRHVYVAYEYAPGRTLRDALRAGELRDRDAVEAGAQVLEGLAHAHARGVVHRDVKPANVLLADGEEISVRLLDFGLAQTEDAETLTAAGDVPGTLAYIPPERLAGEVSGPAGDVWAVGVLLWEALAGVHPFWTSSPLETARAIERGAPPLAEARPDLPRSLTAAVDEALALDPARRPSAARLAHALREALEERARE
jgi:eukaryotic-like serine/threonine-protein kinase